MNIEEIHDLEELICELESVDGMFSAIIIHDNNLYNLLHRKGLAIKNARGGAYGTALLHYIMKSTNNDMDVIRNHLKD